MTEHERIAALTDFVTASFAYMVDRGLLLPAAMEAILHVHRRLAEEAALPRDRLVAAGTAQIAETTLVMAGRRSVAPGLRLVHSSDEERSD